MEVWGDVIGRGASYFDPYQELVAKLGHDLDRETVLNRRKARHLEMVAELEIMPGVRDAVVEAKRLGLRLGVASSSSRSWVPGHLERLGRDRFDCVRRPDDDPHTNPDPDPYLPTRPHPGRPPGHTTALPTRPRRPRPHPPPSQPRDSGAAFGPTYGRSSPAT
mgnify:CR=1 FL=1